MSSVSGGEVNGNMQVQLRDDVDGVIANGGDEKKPYRYSFTYERATLYEYKFERQPDPDPIDPCYRCNRQVPVAEQVNVGVLFHKTCFRCRVCGLPLGRQTFHRNEANFHTDKEVYCRQHIGKKVGEVEVERNQDLPELEQSPISPGNKKYVIQIHGKSRSPNQALPPGQATLTPGQPAIMSSPAGTSMTMVTPHGVTNGTSSVWGYSPDGSTYGAAERAFPHPKPVLKSFEDFETSGVFEAQSVLEDRHKEEEERLQRFLAEEREKEMRRLDDTIDMEKERAASELLASLDQMSIHRNPRDLVVERDRLEEHFRRQREDRLRVVVDKIATEEKNRVGKMVDRHGQEMMILIAEKDREVDQSALFDHSIRPPILPPETKKSTLYKSPTIFERLDKRAVELANRDYSTFTDLVRDLTRDCQNELEKARVLFRWVIAKDLNRHHVNEIVRPNSSANLLKGVRSGKETYHQLYKKLCSYAGLHCEIILGYSKGAGYKPGMRIESNSFRNSWTAVAIDGSWRFVNCTWAARHVTGHKDDLPQVFHKYDEFYFLTDPEDYIYQHYPDEPAWQLLEIPLPFSEFINLPVVKSPFFNYGLKFYSNFGATLTTDNGMVEIRLIAPKILGFGSMLEPLERVGGEAKSLDGRTLLRIIKNEAIFTVSLPRQGLFYFSVYAGDYWHSECLESTCSFLINCTRMSGPAAPPYPPVPYYGPTPIMEKLGITADSHTDPLIVMTGENLEIKFGMNKDTKVTHTFQYFDVQDDSVTDIDRYVFVRSRNDTSISYMVRCSREGYYIFSLFGADGKGEGLDCVFRYLIVCQEAQSTISAFPKTYHRWQRCTLFEPLSGDLLQDKRYNFKLDIPQAVEVFVAIGEIWHHLKRKSGFTWEGNVHTGKTSSVAKIMARYSASRDSSIFAHLLDFELMEDEETEI